jgi:vacuolar-type H+-ATPase subunit I/STV1
VPDEQRPDGHRPQQQQQSQEKRKPRNIVRPDGPREVGAAAEVSDVFRALQDLEAFASSNEDAITQLARWLQDSETERNNRLAMILDEISREHDATRKALEYTQQAVRLVLATGVTPKKEPAIGPVSWFCFAVIVGVVLIAAVVLAQG